MTRPYLITNAVAYLLVPVAVGWITGWLVGQSQSPIVGTTIPLVFGLLTAVGFGAVGAILRKSAVVDALRAMDLSDDIKERIESEVRAGTSPSTAVFAAVGVLIFCGFFYLGTQQGIARRVPTYPPLTETFNNLTLDPIEAAGLYRLRMSMISKGVTVDEYNIMMNDVFKPVFSAPYQAQSREESRNMRLNDFRSLWKPFTVTTPWMT